MKQRNTRRGFTQEVVTKNCHSKFNLESHHCLLHKVRSRIKYGMTPLFNNGGFTLIELLVVVLIIGILAAVVLPQYNKAVRKARLARVISTMKTLAGAMDLYALEHEGPVEESYINLFPGNVLDVDLPPQQAPFSIQASWESDDGGNLVILANEQEGKIQLWYERATNPVGEWKWTCTEMEPNADFSGPSEDATSYCNLFRQLVES